MGRTMKRGGVRFPSGRRRKASCSFSSLKKSAKSFLNSGQPCAVLLFNGRILFHNKAYEAFTGYSASELRKLNWKKDLSSCCDDPVQRERIKKLGSAENTMICLRQYKRKDGSVVRTEVTLTKIGVYIICVFRLLDICDSGLRYRFSIRSDIVTFLHALPIPLVITDRKNRVHFLNDEMRKLVVSDTGAFPENADFSALLASPSKPVKSRKFRTIDEVEYHVLRIRRSDGAEVESFCTFIPVMHPLLGNWVIVLFHLLKEVFLNSGHVDSTLLAKFKITRREKDVLVLLLGGYLYKEIADKLSVSLPTVRTHIQSIYRKFAVVSRDQLFLKFRREGLALTNPSSYISAFFRDLGDKAPFEQ